MSTATTEKLTHPRELKALQDSIRDRQQRVQTTVAVCGGTGCQASGAGSLIKAFAEALAKEGLEETVRLRATGCHGFCERGPLVVVHPAGTFYQRVGLDDVDEIGAAHRGHRNQKLMPLYPIAPNGHPLAVFVKHLDVLRDAGLVNTRSEGRRREARS